MHILEYGYVAWQAKVSVRPLVKLDKILMIEKKKFFFFTWLVSVTKTDSRNKYISQLQSSIICSTELYMNLYAMQPRAGIITAKLSPLVSTKSCLVIAVGSMWCSLKFLSKFLPIKNISTEPQESAAQCTMPLRKSAVKIPQTIQKKIVFFSSNFN